MIRSKLLSKLEYIEHGFSTRRGGVSKGIFESLNLSYGRGDDPEAVRRNFELAGEMIGVKPEDMVHTQQTHTTNVVRVDGSFKGNGITLPNRFKDVDGLVTDVPGLCLVTRHADCVPLYFVDTANKAIGLSHSGWKGTVHGMARVTLDAMRDAFGTKPEDVYAFIGPSICGKCYEVGHEVAELAAACLKDADEEKCNSMIRLKANGKYLLDLKALNREIMIGCGVRPEHIEVSELCTFENKDIFWSHRLLGEKRGSMAAFLCIKK